jgi:serine/threonine protein kinase/tetratricopeptide (TPR) repeat protein
MTGAKRARVDELVGSALAIDPTGKTRPQFQPDDDEAVRTEVERVLGNQNGESTVTLETSAKLLQPDEVIGGRYRILRHLGSGGMGAVYEATDEELGGTVALKTILPELIASEISLTRFRSEVALARKVTHPNVCRVFDVAHHSSSVSANTTFLTMELLHGDTLRSRIVSGNKFDEEETIDIARQIALGLHAVHGAGVIHRDLKTANVMLVRELRGGLRAVLTDFGLARAVLPDQALTAPGTVVGTPAYMAPELFGGAEASRASDIYALGVVIYEMVSGGPPVRTPPPPVNPRLDPVIERCLRLDPRERFDTAAEVIEALEPAGKPRRTIFSRRDIATLALAAAGLIVLATRQRIRIWLSDVPERRHVAVLPFSTVGSSVDRQVFADGLTETLTSKLAELEQFHNELWLVPSSEIRSRAAKTAEESRKAFNVTLAVTGNVQQLENTVRVTANLIDARTLKQIDSRTVDVPVSELFALQNHVVNNVASMLQIELVPPARRVLSAGQTKDPVAYELYQEATGHLRHIELPSVSKAIALLQDAIARDNAYALAYARLAEAYWRKYSYSKVAADIDLSLKNGLRALDLNAGLAPVHASLGAIYNSVGRYDDAARELDKALDLDPKSMDAITTLASLYNRTKRFREAEDTYRRAITLRPDYWLSYNQLGAFYFSQARYEDALQMFSAVASLTPESALGDKNAGAVLIALGRYEEAEKRLKRSSDIEPSAQTYSNLSVCASFQGRYREAVTLLQKSVELDDRNHLSWRNLGDAYAMVPDLKFRAPEAYRKALELVELRLKVSPNNADHLLSAALYQAKLARKDDALSIVAQVGGYGPLNAAQTFKSALIFEIAGERARALETLGRAIAAGYSIEQVRKEPELAGLRQDPRFEPLLASNSTEAQRSRAR